MKLNELIKENPIITIDDYEDKCPYCNEKVMEINRESTLVGFKGESFSKDDVNHHTFTMKCINGHIYKKHQRLGKIWITMHDNELLLQGMPNCFEPVIYICKRCDGYVFYNSKSKIYQCSNCRGKGRE